MRQIRPQQSLVASTGMRTCVHIQKKKVKFPQCITSGVPFPSESTDLASMAVQDGPVDAEGLCSLETVTEF